jgi:hypothetical protein
MKSIEEIIDRIETEKEMISKNTDLALSVLRDESMSKEEIYSKYMELFEEISFSRERIWTLKWVIDQLEFVD